MKKNYLLIVCLILSLFTGNKSYGQTATYNITSLVGSTLNTGCGYTQVFNNGSNSAIGFSWVDGIAAGSTITGVTIYYCVGVNEIISVAVRFHLRLMETILVPLHILIKNTASII